MLTSGVLFGTAPTSNVPPDSRAELDAHCIQVAAAAAGQRGDEVGQRLHELAHRLRGIVTDGDAGAIAEELRRIQETRGAAADYLLEQGDDSLSEAGENYLRSSEWARRVLAIAPWSEQTAMESALELLSQMARLEEEAAAALVRWSHSH